MTVLPARPIHASPPPPVLCSRSRPRVAREQWQCPPTGRAWPGLGHHPQTAKVCWERPCYLLGDAGPAVSSSLPGREPKHRRPAKSRQGRCQGWVLGSRPTDPVTTSPHLPACQPEGTWTQGAGDCPGAPVKPSKGACHRVGGHAGHPTPSARLAEVLPNSYLAAPLCSGIESMAAADPSWASPIWGLPQPLRLSGFLGGPSTPFSAGQAKAWEEAGLVAAEALWRCNLQLRQGAGRLRARPRCVAGHQPEECPEKGPRQPSQPSPCMPHPTESCPAGRRR